MRRDGMAEEFGEVWTLGPADLSLVASLPDSGKLGLVAQLAHWRVHGRFPDHEADLPPAVVGRLAASSPPAPTRCPGCSCPSTVGR